MYSHFAHTTVITIYKLMNDESHVDHYHRQVNNLTKEHYTMSHEIVQNPYQRWIHDTIPSFTK